MRKKVTMQNIADRLHISKNSVSQALSGKPGVSEQTREKVRRVARAMGYHYVRPVTVKRSDKRERKNIALIASDRTFSLKDFFGGICLSIERETTRRGMALQIQSISPGMRDKLILPGIIEHQSIDGLLILSHISTDYIRKTLSSGVPAVLVDQHHPNIDADAVLTNNRFGAYQAVQHLIRLGHKRIGYLGNIAISPSYEERLEGYLLALREYGIKSQPDYICDRAVETDEALQQSMEKIYRLPQPPTAWFCVNDGLGYFASTALQRLKLKVPDDVSICGFDNGRLSQIASPSITTMDVDLNLYGKKAVERLCQRMERPTDVFQEILLPARLIVRGSTGKAPN